MRFGPKYLLVIVDYYSKWPEIYGLRGISSAKVIAVLKRVFGRLGFPNTIVSDNGRQLISKKFSDYLASIGGKSSAGCIVCSRTERVSIANEPDD